MFFNLAAVALLASLAFAGAALAQSKDKKEPKPTGACTITVYGVPPSCTGSMTQDGCNAVAKKYGGSAEWVEGKRCTK